MDVTVNAELPVLEIFRVRVVRVPTETLPNERSPLREIIRVVAPRVVKFFTLTKLGIENPAEFRA